MSFQHSKNKKMVKFMDIHTCEPSGGSIFLPILRVPSVNFQNLPPVKKIKYNKILAYISPFGTLVLTKNAERYEW